MLEVNNLSKVYRVKVKQKKSIFSKTIEKRAVSNVSFDLHKGQAMACIGENGAGKSTLIKCALGILSPTEGQVRLFGEDPRKKKNYCMSKVGVVFGQKTNLWIDIPVKESFLAMRQIYKVDKLQFNRNYEMVMELLDLKEIIDIPARRLSLGQRMRADIGLVLLHNPELLFMDEPTLGLDINVKRTIRQFLKKINEDNGTSILLTSHDLVDIDEICKDAIVLSGGEQIYNGTINDLKIRYRKPDMDDIVSTIFAEGKVV
ncbi:MAG: ATP-binding cassette domain-containing protein [Butyrivibrio sp.]|nr:ATP-binding cassette domain-containing protein [Butyrivibrio sp.]